MYRVEPIGGEFKGKEEGPLGPSISEPRRPLTCRPLLRARPAPRRSNRCENGSSQRKCRDDADKAGHVLLLVCGSPGAT